MGSGTKNLGLIKAIFTGSSAPKNTYVIWYDTTVNYHKYFNGTSWVQLGTSGTVSNITYEKLYSTVTPVGTDSNTNEKTLAEFDILSSKMSLGDVFKIEATGLYANNGNSKRLRLYFGSSFFDTNYETITNSNFILNSTVEILTSTTQKGETNSIAFQNGAGAYQPVNAFRQLNNLSESINSTIKVKITGQNNALSANDILMQTFRIFRISS